MESTAVTTQSCAAGDVKPLRPDLTIPCLECSTRAQQLQFAGDERGATGPRRAGYTHCQWTRPGGPARNPVMKHPRPNQVRSRPAGDNTTMQHVFGLSDDAL